MIVNCWQRFLLAFELPSPRQLYFNESPRLLEEVLAELCHSLAVDLSNTMWAQGWGLINKQSGYASGTVNRIRQILIITFDSTNVLMHNSSTFGASISIGIHDWNFVTVVLCQDIVTFSTVPKYDVTFGARPSDCSTNRNQPQRTVSYLVTVQTIAL